MGRGTRRITAAKISSLFVLPCCIQTTVLCDVIVLYCMKKKYYYREKKYKYVEDYEQVGHLLTSAGGEVEAPFLICSCVR